MIINDAKKAATTIVARLGSPGGTEMKPEYGGELTELAKDFLAAVDQKSPEAVVEAFRAMFLACEAEPHDEAGEAEGPEGPNG